MTESTIVPAEDSLQIRLALDRVADKALGTARRYREASGKPFDDMDVATDAVSILAQAMVSSIAKQSGRAVPACLPGLSIALTTMIEQTAFSTPLVADWCRSVCDAYRISTEAHMRAAHMGPAKGSA